MEPSQRAEPLEEDPVGPVVVMAAGDNGGASAAATGGDGSIFQEGWA